MRTIFRLICIATICYSVSGCRQNSSAPPPNGRFEIHSEDYQITANGEEFTQHALWKIDSATGRTWIYAQEINTNNSYIGWKEVGTIPGVLEHAGNIADKSK